MTESKHSTPIADSDPNAVTETEAEETGAEETDAEARAEAGALLAAGGELIEGTAQDAPLIEGPNSA